MASVSDLISALQLLDPSKEIGNISQYTDLIRKANLDEFISDASEIARILDDLVKPEVSYGDGSFIVEFDGSIVFDDGEVGRSGKTKPMKNITAVTALIRDPITGLYLGVSRKDDPTAFGLPGGKVDPGELPHQAVVRELLEETGLIADEGTVKQVFLRDAEPGPDGKGFYCATYIMAVTGNINTTEAGRVDWITQETLFAGPFGLYNKALFDAVTYCRHCQGKGREWMSDETCRVCHGEEFIARPRALLVDDLRKPED